MLLFHSFKSSTIRSLFIKINESHEGSICSKGLSCTQILIGPPIMHQMHFTQISTNWNATVKRPLDVFKSASAFINVYNCKYILQYGRDRLARCIIQYNTDVQFIGSSLFMFYSCSHQLLGCLFAKFWMGNAGLPANRKAFDYCVCCCCPVKEVNTVSSSSNKRLIMKHPKTRFKRALENNLHVDLVRIWRHT